jgi:hypothetical protein
VADRIQTTTSSGFIGGIEGGDRYQFGKLVIGWEADMTWGNLNGTSNASFGPNPGLIGGINFNRTMTADTNWVGTAVSTVGIAHNNWLLYGKAGVAWDHTTYTDNWGVTVSPGIVNNNVASTAPSSPGRAATIGSVGPSAPASNGRSGTTGP